MEQFPGDEYEGESALPAVQPQSSLVEVEKVRAIQEVQAALVIAKKFPRDIFAAEKRIVDSCKRHSLAEKASYAFPRGKEKITGPSIRLAEVLAQNWGNMQYGFKELERGDGYSEVEAFAWDTETNTRLSRTFTVKHAIRLKDGKDKRLTDPRDIYELVANNAQRRVRAAILSLIPPDVVERAVSVCRATLRQGVNAGEPLVDRIRRMVVAFGEFGVTKEHIEKKLGHTVEATTADELVDMTEIYNSIKDKVSKREHWFDITGPVEGGKAADLNAKFGRPAEGSSNPLVPEQGGTDFENFEG